VKTFLRSKDEGSCTKKKRKKKEKETKKRGKEVMERMVVGSLIRISQRRQ